MVKRRLNSKTNLLASMNLREITIHDDAWHGRVLILAALHESNLSADGHGGIGAGGGKRGVEVEFELTRAGEEVLAEVRAFE